MVEVREVHHLLVVKEGVQHDHDHEHEDLVVEQGKIHRVSIMSPRTKLDVALLLVLRPKYRSSRDELFILLFTIGPAVKEKLPQRT